MSLGRYRTCNQPGCGELVRVGAGKCSAHKSAARKRSDAKRPNASDRGYGAHWRKNVRDPFLRIFNVCLDCGAEATVADHSPVDRAELVRRGEPDPDDFRFLEPRCESCHNSRTAQTTGFAR